MNNSSDLSVLDAVEYVQSLTTIGIKEGRENILRYLKQAEIDHNRLRVFHVTGSNGKGSVCQMIAQVLSKGFGARVGLFISPHLVRITERFTVNGVEIALDDLNSYYLEILERSDAWDIPLSFFEIQVIVAVQFFLREGVDYAVFEVGLGGLYDGTNIWKQPLATYITSICLEHTNILGKTRASVLRNKLGIIKKDTPLFTPFDNKQIRSACRQEGAILCSTKGIMSPANLTNLAGRHQQKNALLVLHSLQYLGFDVEIIHEQLRDICYPGRFQRVGNNCILDTANNTQSISSLIQTLKQNNIDPTEIQLVFGSTQTDPKYCAHLANMFGSRSVFLVDGFCRAHPVSSYQNSVYHVVFDGSISSVLSRISEQKITLIAGSLYLVGAFMELKNI